MTKKNVITDEQLLNDINDVNVINNINEINNANEINEEGEFLPAKEQLKIIKKGLQDIINEEELLVKLERSVRTKQPLIVKFGLDPSAPDIHLGHTVALRKLKQLQDLGHRIIITIGDFTGRIGDPTGRSKVRRQMSEEEVVVNAKTYVDQIMKVLDRSKIEVKFNSEWLSKLNFEDVIALAGKITVARMLERDDFANRYKKQQPIGLHEFFYPLMQAYDSVHLKADIELGGTDQTFNILMGRALQKDYGMESQVAMFVPILEGTDGVQKMSKSLGNYIGIDEEPEVMYRKVMTIPDNLIIRYFELVTDIHPDEVESYRKELESGLVNPRDIKMSLACEITALYHGLEEAQEAEKQFEMQYQHKKIPDNIKVFGLSGQELEQEVIRNGNMDLPSLIMAVGFASSKSEARRLISQNAVKINCECVTDIRVEGVTLPFVLGVGKNKIIRVV